MPDRNKIGNAEDDPHVTGVLFRSHIEIERILRKLVLDATVLSVGFKASKHLFLSRLLYIDPEGEFLIAAYSEERSANTLLLEQKEVVFWANSNRGRIEFTLTAPTHTMFNGAGAVRFAFPQALVQSQRREHPRFKVPADSSLRCVADSTGFAPFEARVIDVSRGGMGNLTYDDAITLEPGTVLKDCKIMLAGCEPVFADLEVRYTSLILQPDGTRVRRSGVKFIGTPKGWDTLLSRFIIELG
jgi:c-di-GMP-binding flagellar brake protein YcgR